MPLCDIPSVGYSGHGQKPLLCFHADRIYAAAYPSLLDPVCKAFAGRSDAHPGPARPLLPNRQGLPYHAGLYGIAGRGPYDPHRHVLRGTGCARASCAHTLRSAGTSATAAAARRCLVLHRDHDDSSPTFTGEYAWGTGTCHSPYANSTCVQCKPSFGASL